MKTFFSFQISKFIAVLFISIALSIIALFSGSSVEAANKATIKEFKLQQDSANSSAYFITPGPDGNLWFTKSNTNKIGKITPKGKITEFDVPGSPVGITVGYGSLWFTEAFDNKIVRFTPGGAITEFPIPTTNSGSAHITLGNDGNLWFTEFYTNKIGRISSSGVITEFDIPTPDSGPQDITMGTDGNLWFTEYYANKIGRISFDGEITEFDVPTESSAPLGIIAGLDGNVWFTESNNTYKIGKITPSGQITEFVIPRNAFDNSSPNYISRGPDGNLWYTRGSKVGRISPDGDITEFTPPTTDSNPLDITTGSDGNVWYTDINSYTIGRVNLSVVPDISQAYVALGDSYSSGWGITPYFEEQSGCERSMSAYSTKVKVPSSNSTYYALKDLQSIDWGFLACGGNTTKQVLNKQLGHKQDPDNNTYLGLDEGTDLVTITVGGNDMEFSKILEFCYLNHANCGNDIYKDGLTLGAWVTNELPVVKTKLQEVYNKIYDQAPNAKIVVLGYPQVFPALSEEQNCTQLRQSVSVNGKSIGFSQLEQNFLRNVGTQLNDTISEAVAETYASGIGNISFVSVTDEFVGHEVCGNGGQWIDGPSGMIENKKIKAKDFVFHPSIRGHEEYANIINNFLTP